MEKLIIFACLFFIFSPLYSQDNFWEKWEKERVEAIYVKQQVPDGSHGPDGEEIDYIFIPATMESGRYEVVIADEEGEIYHIKDTDYYISFATYFGYAGFGKEGILEVNSWGRGYFYRRP